MIKPNGDLMSSPGACEHNGKTYYTFGAQFSKDYSGFDGTPNCTRTGFLMRKFLNENPDRDQGVAVDYRLYGFQIRRNLAELCGSGC
ncbi:hypothetical protein NIB75_23715 [Bacteroides uniformis]|nr:hypothetical protein [Bacteroides uniformis]